MHQWSVPRSKFFFLSKIHYFNRNIKEPHLPSLLSEFIAVDVLPSRKDWLVSWYSLCLICYSLWPSPISRGNLSLNQLGHLGQQRHSQFFYEVSLFSVQILELLRLLIYFLHNYILLICYLCLGGATDFTSSLGGRQPKPSESTSSYPRPSQQELGITQYTKQNAFICQKHVILAQLAEASRYMYG